MFGKKLSTLLLFLVALVAQSQTITKYPASSSQQYGLVVVKSTNAPAKAPLIVFLHGMGEWGPGTSAALDKVVGGIPATLKAGVEKYGFILVAPQTGVNGAFIMGEINFAHDWAVKNLQTDTTREYLTGLSLGAGGTAWFPRQSLTTALMFDAIAPIATTWQGGGGYRNLSEANLPVWFLHNLGDNNGNTPYVASKWYIDSLLSWKPAIAPALTGFDKIGHGGWSEGYSATKIPMPPGSTGMTLPSVNLFEWFLLNSRTRRVSVPTGPVIPEPPKPKAVVTYDLVTRQVLFDDGSTETIVTARYNVATRQITLTTSGGNTYTF